MALNWLGRHRAGHVAVVGAQDRPGLTARGCRVLEWGSRQRRRREARQRAWVRGSTDRLPWVTVVPYGVLLVASVLKGGVRTQLPYAPNDALIGCGRDSMVEYSSSPVVHIPVLRTILNLR